MLRWRIGEVTVTRIVDDTAYDLGPMILPEVTKEMLGSISWLSPHYVDADGNMILSIHGLLVETPDRKILVDTCIGNDKDLSMPAWSQRSSSFLDDLASQGGTRDAIDTVLCTHLHVDHVGFNTVLENGKWAPTFRNARYLFGRKEFEYWKDEPDMVGPVFGESVQPIVDAGLAELVEMDHKVCAEVALEPTPGHTPGHVSVHIRSAGEEAVITGDMLHHPCQIARPDWTTSVDFDKEQSQRTKREFLGRYAEQPVLVIGTHFATPTAGHIVRDGDTYRLDA
ncbi:MAG: MBL fold metallo-hydrolase [Deltaproteobacteria bacterium]|nr:MBL fold metallo-hydrolase [Deltaproteobacteria bacterium]